MGRNKECNEQMKKQRSSQFGCDKWKLEEKEMIQPPHCIALNLSYLHCTQVVTVMWNFQLSLRNDLNSFS